MALVNILAQSSSPINWEHILDRYSNLSLTHIENFPIPKELGFAQDAIGISVHQGYNNNDAVILDLKKAVDFFKSSNLALVELYDGVEIVPGNIDVVFGGLLKG